LPELGLSLDNRPLPLNVQEELVGEHKDTSETGAGDELIREFDARIMGYQEEMCALKEQMEQTMNGKDGETKKELEIETQRKLRYSKLMLAG
jgi:hypothetical protein